MINIALALTRSVGAQTRRLIAAWMLLLFSASALAQTYNWNPVVIKGGGFVSGIITHPNASGVIYCRTDIGGAYRWNSTNNSWIPLLDFAADANIYGVESLAIDPSDSNRLYIAASRGSPAVLLVSTNQGATFSQFTPPFSLNGNVDGRSNGERMAVDPNLNRILFYGSRTAGLYKSVNYGTSWSQVSSFPVTSTANGAGLVLVEFIKSSGVPGSATPTIFAGVSRPGGTNLFRSTDGGTNWTSIAAGAPTNQMPHHVAQDGLGNLYVTFNDNCGPNNITTGTVRKLNLSTLASSDVTPPPGQGGFSGVSVDRQHPTNILVSTMDRWYPDPQDQIYRSTNGGASWKTTNPTAPGTSPAPWSVAQFPHWAGDVEIDPFNSNRAWYITGYGIIGCTNLTASDSNGTVNWNFTSDGIEETVPLGLASPPSGPYLLSAHGDIGGFRHFNLDASPPLADYFSTHRVTSLGIDFAENNPNIIVRLFSGSPYGCVSLNGGTTWQDFASVPPGTTGDNRGDIAVSADGSRIVWIPQNTNAYYSINNGTTWTVSTGSPTGNGTRTPISDRVNSNKFYIYSSGAMYVSTNGGVTFAANGSVSSVVTPRTVFGREGDIWVPRGNSGLSRSTNSGLSFSTVTSVQRASFVSFGKAAPGQSYPAGFISGRVTNVDGIFRSDDAGVSWTRINDAQNQFGLGSIHTFCADPRVYGRVYFGTEGRGIIYGDLQAPPAAPINLTALAGDGEVTLAWAAASGATNYYIKQSTISGGSYTAIGTNTSGTFTNTGLNNGTIYYYVVSALNAAGESGNSAEVSARPVSLAPAPVSIGFANDQIQLAWPPDHTGWRLEAQTSAPGLGLGTNWITLTDSASTNQFFIPMDATSGSVFFRLVYP